MKIENLNTESIKFYFDEFRTNELQLPDLLRLGRVKFCEKDLMVQGNISVAGRKRTYVGSTGTKLCYGSFLFNNERIYFKIPVKSKKNNQG